MNPSAAPPVLTIQGNCNSHRGLYPTHCTDSGNGYNSLRMYWSIAYQSDCGGRWPNSAAEARMGSLIFPIYREGNASMSRYWLLRAGRHFRFRHGRECLGPGSPQSAAQSARACRHAAESAAATSGKFLTIPGLAPLSMEGVQRDIGLTPEQKQQLKTVSDGLRGVDAAVGQVLQRVFAGRAADTSQRLQRPGRPVRPQRPTQGRSDSHPAAVAGRGEDRLPVVGAPVRWRIPPCKRSSASARSNVSG